MDKTKPFGLVLPKRAQTFPVKTNAVFDSDSDDEPAAKKKAAMKIPQAKPLSKKLLKVEQCEDPSIFEYDSIYDDMKAKEVSKIAPKSDKPSRYIDSLLKAADKRKKNYERRLEKKVQAEREQEGDKFKDKEAFVTSAYKKKMQEMEEEEERERRESQMNDMMDVTKQKDLSGFYRHFLKQSVGEEKIPVFGERMDIKKEPETEPDLEIIVKTEDDSTVKGVTLDSDLDRDSVIASSSDDESPDSVKVQPIEKVSTDDGKKSDENHSSHTSVNKVKKIKHHRQIRKKTAEDDSDSEGVETEMTRPQRQSRKKIDDNDDVPDSMENERETKQSSEDSDSDSPDDADQKSEITKTNDSVVDEGLSNDVNDDSSETKKTKERKNVFEKRTVGSVFADAQARYFQRMATRSS